MDLIFRQRRRAPFEVEAPVPGARFRLAGGPVASWRSRAVIRASTAQSGALRRALSPIRFFYYVEDADGAVAHHGWLRVTRRGLHTLRGPGIVIGPIQTAPDSRGRGFARYATQCAMNAMLRRGFRTFYISAAQVNEASLALIAACEFGEPAATRGNAAVREDAAPGSAGSAPRA